jgi:esterase/lipase
MDKSLINFTASSERLCWDYSNLNFSEYLVWIEELIKKNRCDLTPKTEQKIIAANKPFELVPEQPSQRGILLIHGLLSCPLAMHDIGQHFKNQGFLVRSVLLPGHGTRPGDLRNVNLEDWIATVEFGLNSLKQEVEHLWIGGFSGGADLALYSAFTRPDIKGVILFAPSIKLKNPLAPLTSTINQLSKKFQLDYWPDIDHEHDYAKYHSYPIHFAAQAHKLTKIVRHIVKKNVLTCPVLMILSEDDETVSSITALKFFHRCTNPKDRLIWYGKKKPPITDPRIIYRKSSFPSENILDFSHACLTFSAENSHYGRNGDYLPPLHVPTTLLLDSSEHHGALSKHNLKNYVIRRILYNPDFSFMIQELDKFIAKTQANKS